MHKIKSGGRKTPHVGGLLFAIKKALTDRYREEDFRQIEKKKTERERGGKIGFSEKTF